MNLLTLRELMWLIINQLELSSPYQRMWPFPAFDILKIIQTDVHFKTMKTICILSAL